MRVLVDGVVFGGDRGVVADGWERLLGSLVHHSDLRIELLDRGGAPTIDGITSIDFPSYRGLYAPADSQMIQRVASQQGSEVFVSTGWTTPTTTPSIAVLFGDAPPPMAVLSDRQRGECALAIRHASRLVCMEEQATIALREHVAQGQEQLVAVVDTVSSGEGGDGAGRWVGSALRAAAAAAPAAVDFYRRWAAIRDLQARVDG